MSNTKKIALMSTLVLLLAVTAIFNFVLAGTRDSTVHGDASVQVNYFTSYRAERSSKRSEEFAQLDSVISAYATDSAEYSEAVARKQELVEIMEDEESNGRKERSGSTSAPASATTRPIPTTAAASRPSGRGPRSTGLKTIPAAST